MAGVDLDDPRCCAFADPSLDGSSQGLCAFEVQREELDLPAGGLAGILLLQRAISQGRGA